MFPVFVSVKNSARKTVCISNFRQAYLAAMLYVADYDDTFMPVNYEPGASPNPQNDTTWVQMLLPYLRSYGIFQCPSDNTQPSDTEASFDRDLVPGDVYSRFYSASLRTNLGYNYLYLAPISWTGNSWLVQPRISAVVANPGGMLMFVDSVWDRDAAGNPVGGGNWLVIPPCRFRLAMGQVQDSFQVGNRQVFGPPGWSVDEDNSGLRYGGAWARHMGRATVIRLDGNATALTPSELSLGCDVQENWNGLISNPS
jgi:hypothetical protein